MVHALARLERPLLFALLALLGCELRIHPALNGPMALNAQAQLGVNDARARRGAANLL